MLQTWKKKFLSFARESAEDHQHQEVKFWLRMYFHLNFPISDSAIILSEI